VRAPLAYGAQMGGPTDWAFESEPEPGCDGRRIPQPRGKVLGGTSAMNAMVWVRGTRCDYDGWRLAGWGWNDVEPVFRRIESGPMRVTRVAEPDEVSHRFVTAARAIGVAANDDLSGPDLDGAAISPVTVWRGRRWSTARAYLDPARRLGNFSVVSGALVRRIVISDGAAVGVEYERRGRPHTAVARREIVLSAGAYGTPQLLQVSGVGPAEHLRSVGIVPLVDSPQVGQNLMDHPATIMNWELAPGFIGLADARSPKWLLRWLFRHSGKLTSNLMEAVAHIRSAPGLPAPDFQLIAAPIYVRLDEISHPRPALSILQSYWTPESRGSVMVSSPDSRDAPAIRLNTLTVADDAAAFIRAIRRAREIVSTEPLASALTVEVHPGPSVNTDAELQTWIRGTVATTGHPACSAAMGTEPDSVLDPQLRVRGVARLRVADASALPRIPGERCADFILAACG
jgi:choline dehydrogenase